MQVTLTIDEKLPSAFGTCREFILHQAAAASLPMKALAADMDLSPSQLSRKLSQSPNDSMRFTLDDFENYLRITKDTKPLIYLAAKYLMGEQSERVRQLEEEIARIKREFNK